MGSSFKPIRPLLVTGTSPWSRWFSYIGLCTGVLLLLCSIQMFINIQFMVKEGNIRKNGFDYVPIMKTVTNETIRQPEKNLFTQQDIDEIKSKPFVNDAAPLVSNQFPIQMTGGTIVPFQTDFFVESIDNDFLDTLPPSFNWQEGREILPIIFSSDFFNYYKVFAPSQSLPQFSREAVIGLAVTVSCNGNGQHREFVGKIVAFSDRVSSVLVPKTFLDWANKTFGQQKQVGASRVFIKTKDANNPQFLSFLDSKNYSINKDVTALGRNKGILQSIISGLAIYGLIVVVLALMLFSFYLQLIIARSKDNLKLLLILGYSPSWLSKKVSGRFLPVYVFIVLIALLLTEAAHWSFYHFVLDDNPQLSPIIHWSVLVAAAILVVLSLITNYRMVKKQLYRL